MEHGFVGKFFVWTKSGHRPRFAHDTYDSAVKEAKRLALNNPGRKFIVQQFFDTFRVEAEDPSGCETGVSSHAEKEPAMNDNKTIWYGAKDNEVRFSTNKSDLNNAGIDNPRSFTVSGEVNGLNLTDQPQTSQSGSAQHA